MSEVKVEILSSYNYDSLAAAITQYYQNYDVQEVQYQMAMEQDEREPTAFYTCMVIYKEQTNDH